MEALHMHSNMTCKVCALQSSYSLHMCIYCLQIKVELSPSLSLLVQFIHPEFTPAQVNMVAAHSQLPTLVISDKAHQNFFIRFSQE